MPGIIGPGAGGGATASGDPQVLFVNSVAQQTGLDPRVVYTWTVAEGAYAPGGTGHYNYLNLRPYPGDPYSGVSSGNFEQFSNVNDAITATVRRINQPFALVIRQSIGKPPVQQLQAIGQSAWDAGHYLRNGQVGGKLIADFTSRYGQGALGGKPQSQPLPGAGAGASGDQTKLPGPGSVLNFLTPDWLNVHNTLRALQVVAGAVLVMVGLYLLARQVGLAFTAPSPVRAAAAAVPSAQE